LRLLAGDDIISVTGSQLRVEYLLLNVYDVAWGGIALLPGFCY
jgi:hypothetical protein